MWCVRLTQLSQHAKMIFCQIYNFCFNIYFSFSFFRLFSSLFEFFLLFFLSFFRLFCFNNFLHFCICCFIATHRSSSVGCDLSFCSRHLKTKTTTNDKLCLHQKTKTKDKLSLHRFRFTKICNEVL
jgi:hypothetical protein